MSRREVCMEKSNSFPFHIRLKYEREQRGWSQEYLAGQVGSDPKTVGRWERGERQPQAHYRRRLIELFGIDASEFGLTLRRASKGEQTSSSALGIVISSQDDSNLREQGRILREDVIEMPVLDNFY